MPIMQWQCTRTVPPRNHESSSTPDHARLCSAHTEGYDPRLLIPHSTEIGQPTAAATAAEEALNPIAQH